MSVPSLFIEGNKVIPMFNHASGIYTSDDLKFMYLIYVRTMYNLIQSKQFYHDTELRKTVFKLYSCGIRDADYLSALASQLMKHRYLRVRNLHAVRTANNNAGSDGAVAPT